MKPSNGDRVSFGAKIPVELKEKLDSTVGTAKLHMGFVVERLAEFAAEKTPEQLIRFCYPKATRPNGRQKRRT